MIAAPLPAGISKPYLVCGKSFNIVYKVMEMDACWPQRRSWHFKAEGIWSAPDGTPVCYARDYVSLLGKKPGTLFVVWGRYSFDAETRHLILRAQELGWTVKTLPGTGT